MNNCNILLLLWINKIVMTCDDKDPCTLYGWNSGIEAVSKQKALGTQRPKDRSFLARIIYAHLHSCNTLFIKSKQHSSQFPPPISVSVSESFNNIWRYVLAQARSKRRGNRYFQNWNWDVLFTAFAISFKILQFIFISTHLQLNFIRLLLSGRSYSGMFSWSMHSVWFSWMLCRISASWILLTQRAVCHH